MKYFNKYFLEKEQIEGKIKGLYPMAKPIVGEVLKIFFSKKGSNYFFEGFCYSIKRKNFEKSDACLKLINKIKGSFISFSFSFFYNLVFSFEKVDFKKNKKRFRSAKVFFYKQIRLL